MSVPGIFNFQPATATVEGLSQAGKGIGKAFTSEGSEAWVAASDAAQLGQGIGSIISGTADPLTYWRTGAAF